MRLDCTPHRQTDRVKWCCCLYAELDYVTKHDFDVLFAVVLVLAGSEEPRDYDICV